jgi:hypothetical protein
MEGQNYKSADIILQKLCNDPIDSHARAINDLIPEFIANGLTCIGPYLDSRLQQTLLLKDHLRRGSIRKDNDLDYGLTSAQLWPNKHELRNKVFDTSIKIDTEVRA